MRSLEVKNLTKTVLSFGLLPLIFYLFCFCCLTFPLILNFSSHFFCDVGDGFTNIWNIWWVNKAVTDLNQFPMFTDYIHFPHGTSLLAHTLNPFNGMMGIILLKFLTLVQTHNFIIVFSFVVGGFTAFLLAFYFTRSYWGSLIAGFIFTFSNYHFAHTAGHMQLVSLEWIPLFLLLWFIFLDRPSMTLGIAASLTLFFVILCDYYYFLYVLIVALIIFIWHIKKNGDVFFLFKKKFVLPLSAFAIGILLSSMPFVIAFVLFAAKSNIMGTHDSRLFSLDLLAPLIPGGHWRFAEWTQTYWANLPGNFNESSVHLGISVIFVLFYVLLKRKKIQMQSLGLWSLTLMVFLILSLGPVLRIWGKEISGFILPYSLLELIFPLLRIAGIPVRMMVIVILCASLLFAAGFKHFVQSSSKKRYLIVLLLLVLCFEYLPRPVIKSNVEIPQYVKVLKDLPDKKGVIDMVSTATFALYYQTIHEKPLAFGYFARIPESVLRKNDHLMQLIELGKFSILYQEFQFRYLISKKIIRTSIDNPIHVIFQEGDIRIYDLKPTPLI